MRVPCRPPSIGVVVQPTNRTSLVWCPNQEIVAVILRPKSLNHICQFWGPNRKTQAISFEAKPEKTIPAALRPNHWQTVSVVLRLNHWQTIDIGFEAQPRNLRFSSPRAQCRLHAVSPDLPVTEYLTCAIIPGPLHQVSYSCHDHRHCPSCRTYHLHTTRQENTILQNVTDSNSNLGMPMTNHISNQDTDHLVFQGLSSWFLFYSIFYEVFDLTVFFRALEVA
jgi:hypothetical protein